MTVKKGKYLICITRTNDDFYRYDLTDDVEEAIETFIKWGDKGNSVLYRISISDAIIYRGIAHYYNRPHLFLIDLTFNDSDVLRGNTLISQTYLMNFKRIKRLYKLKCLSI